MTYFINIVYFISAVLFILGLKQMSSPKTARTGMMRAGIGMIAATVVTFLLPGMENTALILLAIVAGGSVAYVTAKRAQMTAMPQMIAIYNGMGGGAAAAIALVEILKDTAHGFELLLIAVIGAIIGSVSFSGSTIAFAKLQGLINRTIRLPQHNIINLVLFALVIVFGLFIATGFTHSLVVTAFIILALLLGVSSTLSIGGADMPVIISLYNAFTGLAVALEGLVVDNAAMIIAGTVVGAAGTLLTHLMAKAMNRSLTNVLFSSFGSQTDTQEGGSETTGEMKSIEPSDAAAQLAYCSKVIIVPGYGMAVAQAQHKLWEFCQLLQKNDVEVRFAIHPVAGRMPGHMNVLLAESGVPYDLIFDLDEINEEFKNTDVAIVLGANDVVNPSAKNDKASPIYGMPILNVDEAQHTFVIKRGKGTGFSGLANALFFADNTRMIYGDAQKVLSDTIQAMKEL